MTPSSDMTQTDASTTRRLVASPRTSRTTRSAGQPTTTSTDSSLVTTSTTSLATFRVRRYRGSSQRFSNGTHAVASPGLVMHLAPGERSLSTLKATSQPSLNRVEPSDTSTTTADVFKA